MTIDELHNFEEFDRYTVGDTPSGSDDVTTLKFADVWPSSPG